MKQLALEFDLAPLPRLANFVPAGNEAAVAHLGLWVDNPLRAPVPTYLWGATGCGKTHLLRSVAGELMAQGSAVGWLDASVLMPPPSTTTGTWCAWTTATCTPPSNRRPPSIGL